MDSNKSPELIEQEMQETRQSLAEKVGALENQVVGTIQSATSAVQDTIESVKSVVTDTVSTVKDTVGDVKESVEDSVSSVSEGVMHAFDIRHHVDQHPWLMVGGAAAAGFLTGLLVFRKEGSGLGLFTTPVFKHASYTPTMYPAAAPARQYAPEREEPAPRRDEPKREEPRRPGWLDELFDRAGREVSKLGEMALASVVASLERNISEGLPRLIDRSLHMTDQPERGPAGQPVDGPESRFPR